MRGGFVACFGRPAAGLLERAAEAHRWHRGLAEHHEGYGLRAVLLVDGEDGPRFERRADRVLLIHGEPRGGLAELRQAGHRFAGLECDGRQLWAARDPMGLCPLFYRVFDGALWLATEVCALAALGSVEPDLVALGEQVALLDHGPQTGWRGILRLLPGHSLHVTAALEARTERYWRPERMVGRFRGGIARAEVQLRQRLLAAVDRAAPRRAGVLLSGGLDSAAVAAAAGLLERAGWLVHVAFPGFDGADEQRYARAVASSIGLALDVVSGELRPWDPLEDLRTAALPYLTPPHLTAEVGLKRLASLGADLALDGNDGDGVLGYPGREWGELVRTGRLGRLSQLARAHGLATVIRHVADDLIPPQLRARRARGRPPLGQSYLRQTERYFCAALRTRMRGVDLESWRGPIGAWRERQLRQVMPVTTIRMEEHELRGARFGLDLRHPFADRELVELLISLSAAVKNEPFQPKARLRGALREVLPTEVLHRPDKALYLDVLERRVDPDLCLEVVRSSGVRLPQVNYELLYRDALKPQGVPIFLLMLLARVHSFASGG